MIKKLAQSIGQYTKYAILRNDYDISYDNVPAVFTRPDGFKFHYKDCEYGGITPCGPEKYNDFEAFKQEAFNKESYSSNRVENYKLEKDGMEWDIYVSHRNIPDNDGDGKIDEEWANGYFDRDVAIKFGDTGYAEHLYVYSAVSEADMKAFIEGMQLVKLAETSETDVPFDEVSSYDVVETIYYKKENITLEYSFIPEGFEVDDESTDNNMLNLVRADEVALQPTFCKFYGDSDEYADEIFNSNPVSKGGTVEKKRLSGKNIDKNVYINYRKEGPCEGETKAEWQERRANDWYDRDVVVTFDKTAYAVYFSVYHDVSDEELMQFIDGMELK